MGSEVPNIRRFGNTLAPKSMVYIIIAGNGDMVAKDEAFWVPSPFFI